MLLYLYSGGLYSGFNDCSFKEIFWYSALFVDGLLGNQWTNKETWTVRKYYLLIGNGHGTIAWYTKKELIQEFQPWLISRNVKAVYNMFFS